MFVVINYIISTLLKECGNITMEMRSNGLSQSLSARLDLPREPRMDIYVRLTIPDLRIYHKPDDITINNIST
jgi:hypothetical protein